MNDIATRRDTPVIIAIGSNTDAEAHLTFARRGLERLFESVVFSRQIWTSPVDSPTSEPYLNCVAKGKTHHSAAQVYRALKQLERQCRSSKREKRVGVTRLDLDLMQYGTEKYHLQDWQRDYIRVLTEELAQTE